MLFIRQKTLITQPSFWIWNEAGRVEVDRGRVGHAGDLPGSAEKARFLGGVFRVQPKWLDEICCNFIFQLRSKFATKFTGYPPGGGRQGGELDVWAYMKGYLNDFCKTDPCAREFRQRSIIAPNMVMCALNVRPLQEVKVAILDPLWDCTQNKFCIQKRACALFMLVQPRFKSKMAAGR